MSERKSARLRPGWVGKLGAAGVQSERESTPGRAR